MGRLIPLLFAFAAAAPVTGAEVHHWSYSGPNGPSHWGETCNAGKVQSPIDIRTRDAHAEPLAAPAFDYRPTPLHIIDNGHSIQINVEPGSTLRFDGKSYQLIQFHFHHPSEERIDGKAAEMVVHLVHRDAEGKLAVVAVMLDPGPYNATIDRLWSHIPKVKEHQEDFAGELIDPSRLLPAERRYFAYTGSLTTPPCTEGVRWIVMRSPVPISAREIAVFAKLYPNDARPVQPTNGRVVLTSN